MTFQTIYMLRRRALLDYYKEQGLVGIALYRRVIIALKEFNRRSERWNAQSS